MRKTAKAAVFTGVNEPFEIREYPVAEPPAGMALLSLVASGICGTDRHIHEGRLGIAPPKIIGHEFIGRVERLGEGCDGFSEGENVIVDIACPCGECKLCRSGDDANCVSMGVTNGGDPDTAPHFWGGYAEVSYAPYKNLIKIPDALDPVTVSVYACAGPTSLHAFSLAAKAGCDIAACETAVVQGLGPVGTFTVLYLSKLGVKNIIAVSAHNDPSRESLVRKLGATEVTALENGGADKLKKRVAELSDGLGADLVIEASGAADAFPLGLELLRNRGVYLVPGQYSNRGGVSISPELITFKALHIIGSSQYSVSDVKDYLGFLEKSPDVYPAINSIVKKFCVENINEAFGSPSAIKCILV